MDPIESVEYNGVVDHGWKQVPSRKRNRKQKKADHAANENLLSHDRNRQQKPADQAANEYVSNGVRNENLKAEDREKPNWEMSLAKAAENLNAEERENADWEVSLAKAAARKREKPDWEASLAEAAAKIGPLDLTEFLDRVPDRYPPAAVFRIARFLDFYQSALAGVPCPWREMFKDSDLSNLFHVFHVPLSHIPEPVYQTSVDWLHQQVSDMRLCGFVLWTFNYILCDLFIQRGGKLTCLLPGSQPGDPCKSEVSIFVTLAMVVRSKPHVFTMVLPSLRTKRQYQGQGDIPLTVWLIAQASQDNLPVGLYSWAHNLLPLVPSKPKSRDLIMKLVEKILAKPDAPIILVNAPVWKGERLIPPYSFVILLQLTFPATSAREEVTSRFEAIYPLLKKVALAGTSGSEEIKQIFNFCLILSGEGNTVLAKEATAIAIWSLAENVDCWKHWENIYKKNQEASVAFLKKLVGQCKDNTLGSEAMIKQIFTFSLKLAGEGNPVLPKKVTAIAIWSLTIIVDCWKHRGIIYEDNLKACVALLKKLVEEWKDHSLKLSSSPRDTLASSPGSKAMKQITRNIFIFSLRSAGEGNTVLAEEATAIAIWSLTENVDCWKHWENIYKKNLEASFALLKKLVWQCKDNTLGSEAIIEQLFTFSLKLAGKGNTVLAKEATAIAIWSLTENVDCWKHWENTYKKNLEASVALLKTLVGQCKDNTLGNEAMIQQIFTFSLKLAGEGITVLAKEATAIAIWSLTENVECWKHWENLYKENLEASVALLKKLVDEWKDHSLKLSSSPSGTLTLSQTMKSFMLKNKKAITEKGANGSLYKEADKSCKVISRRLSRGSSSLKVTTIIAVVLAAGALLALVLSSNPEAIAELKNLVDSLELHLYVNANTPAFKN